MKKIIAGYDVSSSTTGWCILEIIDDKINYLDSGYFKPIKSGTIFERLDNCRSETNKVLKKYKPDYIGIENTIEFMKGASSSKTIISLSLFNRTVGMAAYDYLGSSPELFNVMSIRHGLKLSKELPKKEDIPDLAARHLGVTFPYYYGKNAKIKAESYDVGDAWAVATYYSFILTGKIKKKK
jgi:hypothetical protein